MQFECCLGSPAGAIVVPVVSPTATVAPTSLNKQTPGEEYGVRGLQLFTQVYGVVTRSTAVLLDIVVETVKINWKVRRRRDEINIYLLLQCPESLLISIYFNTLPFLFNEKCLTVFPYDMRILSFVKGTRLFKQLQEGK